VAELRVELDVHDLALVGSRAAQSSVIVASVSSPSSNDAVTPRRVPLGSSPGSTRVPTVVPTWLCRGRRWGGAR
jgi:hypothetical protein